MNRDRINWNSDPLIDELSKQPVDEDLLGVDWGDVGRKILGGSHITGKVLLKTFAPGVSDPLVEKMEALQSKGGVLPAWATKTLRVTGPDAVVIKKDLTPLRIIKPRSVLVFGGSATSGAYDPSQVSFSIAVENPNRVEVTRADGSTIAFTDVNMAIFLGGSAEGNIDVSGDDEMGINLTDLDADLQELLGTMSPSEKAKARAEILGAEPSELARARALLAANIQRRDEARARQGYVPSAPTPITPGHVPAIDLTQLLQALRSDMATSDNETQDLAEEVLGEIWDAYEHEIVGHGYVEIVGDDYHLGSEVLGAPVDAVASRAQVAARGKPPQVAITKEGLKAKRPARTVTKALGRKAVKVAQPSKKKSPHVASIQRAQRVKNRASRAGSQLNNRLKLIKQKIAAPTRVHGIEAEIMGAVARNLSSRTPVTPRQQAAKRKLDKARAKVEAAISKAQNKGNKAITAANHLDQSIAKAKPQVAKLLARSKVAPTKIARGATHVRGDDDTLETMLDSMGYAEHDLFEQAALWTEDSFPSEVLGLDPSDPNYDPRFDDPNYSGDYSPPGDGAAPPAPSAAPSDPLSDPFGAAPQSSGSWQDYYEGDIPLPVRGEQLTRDEAQTVFNTVPPDGVVYQGDKGLPATMFGSWNVFYGTTEPLPTGGPYPDGFGFMSAGGDTPSWFVRDKRGVVRSDVGPEQVSNMSFYERPTDNMKNFWPPPDSLQNVQAAARNSIQQGWGPLIGTQTLDGLQYAVDDDKWFWQANKAPKWATAAIDAEIDRLNKEARQAAQDAYAADQARLAIDNAERERNQAAQEYEQSVATSQAELESAITADKLNQQQAVADQQTVAAQTALDLQSQKSELDYETKQGLLDQQAQEIEQRAISADLEYAIAHPDEAANMEQQYGEEGFTDQYADNIYPDQMTQEMYEEGNGADYADDEAAAAAMDLEE